MTTAADHLEALLDVASRTGLFERSEIGESKSAPTNEGLSLDVFGMTMEPVESSGLASLSVRVEFHFRIMYDMLTEPRKQPDVEVLRAADVLMAAFAAGYTLGGTLRMIDLLGADGQGMRAEAGYVSIDKRVFRVMDVFAPIVVNDHWPMAG